MQCAVHRSGVSLLCMVSRVRLPKMSMS
jgi:hypothetical protein